MEDYRLYSMPVDKDTEDALIAKCQENGWLKRGGYAWQDDPFLEDYPYSFSSIDDLDDLRKTLGQGNWSLRQGFLYKDLAFIQQQDGGDEWWTLKKTDEGWLDFESWSFERIAENYFEFATVIESMCEATPEECSSLNYMKDADYLAIPPRKWQAESLPEGWTWVLYHDGSGHLSAPDGEKRCEFDMQTREYTDAFGQYHVFEGFEFDNVEKSMAQRLAKDPGFQVQSLTDKANEVRQAAAGLNPNVQAEQTKDKKR